MTCIHTHVCVDQSNGFLVTFKGLYLIIVYALVQFGERGSTVSQVSTGGKASWFPCLLATCLSLLMVRPRITTNYETEVALQRSIFSSYQASSSPPYLLALHPSHISSIYHVRVYLKFIYTRHAYSEWWSRSTVTGQLPSERRFNSIVRQWRMP